ncbi:Hypothetical predicted protein [Cloeon dipterum]|uniref:RNA-directed DNA polymerase n=1 Tax=Cloeon dipterum TaxID=197152 RepID=A0A8S1DZT9_9INSE|nr:Hypothetical predicted protein [Cloeon dipterum]
MRKMEVDTGATFSLIGYSTWLRYKAPQQGLLPSTIKMRPWGQETDVRAAGVMKLEVWVQGEPTPKQLELLVMQQNGPSLIGRNWFPELGITMKLPQLQDEEQKRKSKGNIVNKVPRVISPGLGRFKGEPIHVSMQEDAVPKQHAARSVPYALLEKTDRALDSLEKNGVIEKVLSSDWAHPVVIVDKGDEVRICADLSLSLNPQAKRADFPLPKADDLRTKVKPGYHISRFDLKDAYLQFELDEESSMLMVINTHRGRFRFRRLPPEVEFLGFLFTKSGIKPTTDKIRALVEMPYPETREELQAYLGLLKKGVKFDFDEKCRKAVDYAKGVMSKKPCLAFYDANLPVVVACDGSRKGIGAVLSHVINHEEEVEIEALSVVWAVKKFRQFLWGRPFTLVTDHKPLLGIFGRAKGINEDLPIKLKRLPLKNEEGEEEELEVADYKIAFMECFQKDKLLTLEQLKNETEKDEQLVQVKKSILQGRAIVPRNLRDAALDALHLVHFGIAKMKSLARSYFWWPGLEGDIEALAASCEPCLLVIKSPNKSLVIPWSIAHGAESTWTILS